MTRSDISSFGREADRVAAQVAYWSPARWRIAPCEQPTLTRAEALHAAIQRLADMTAHAEGQPARRVPRPEHDGTLPNQWRVMVRDFCAAEPSMAELDTARGVLAEVRHALFTSTS